MFGGGFAQKPIMNADDLNETLDSKNNRFEEIKREQAKNREKFGSGMSSTQA
jgi:hypothetical protein